MIKRAIPVKRLIIWTGFLLLSACQPIPPPFECTDAIGCVEIAPGEPIKIGMLRAIKIGPDHHRGVELALAERDNQVLGHPVELQIEDEGCTSEGGTVTALRVIADPQMVAVIGTTCSGAAITAAKIISEAGLTMISGSNTAPSLTSINGEQGPDWQPGYLRTAHNEANGVQMAATFIYQELGISKVATINDGDAYTRGFTDLFGQTFADLGGEIVLDTAVNKGELDLEPVLTAVSTAGAELIFFPIFPAEAEKIVKQAQNIPELENIIYMGAGALLSDDFIAAIGEAGIGMYFAGRTQLEGPAFDNLMAAHESQYSEEAREINFTYIYDAANLLLNAIERVAIQDPNAGGSLYIGRRALRDELYTTANFEGVTGSLTCDQFGDCSTIGFVILQLNEPTTGVEGLLSNVIYPIASGQ